MKMRKMTAVIFVLMFVCVSIISSAQYADAATNVKLGHVLAVNSPGHKAALWFAEEINKRTNGELVVHVYANSELGSDRELIESVGLGAIDMCVPAPSVLSPFVPRLAVFNLPFLFENLNQAQAVVDSEAVRPILDATVEGSNLRILSCWDNGFRQLITRAEPVRTLRELRTKKIRIPQSEFYTQLWNTMGCTGVSLAYSEIYTALQTGVADGCELPLCNFAASGFAEVTKSFTFTNYTWDPLLLACGEKFWGKLSPEQQKVFMEVAKESSAYQRKLVNEEEKRLQESLNKDFGITFYSLTPEARQEFVDAVKPMYDQYKFQEDLTIIRDAIAATPNAN